MDGIFDLLIPQAIGKWVQHGDACSVNHRHHFVETQGDAGTRPDITKEKRAIQDRHGCPACRAVEEASHLPSAERIFRMGMRMSVEEPRTVRPL